MVSPPIPGQELDTPRRKSFRERRNRHHWPLYPRRRESQGCLRRTRETYPDESQEDADGSKSSLSDWDAAGVLGNVYDLDASIQR